MTATVGIEFERGNLYKEKHRRENTIIGVHGEPPLKSRGGGGITEMRSLLHVDHDGSTTTVGKLSRARCPLLPRPAAWLPRKEATITWITLIIRIELWNRNCIV